MNYLWLGRFCEISPYHNKRPASLKGRRPELMGREQGACLTGGRGVVVVVVAEAAMVMLVNRELREGE